jgi:hypothetical protein
LPDDIEQFLPFESSDRVSEADGNLATLACRAALYDSFLTGSKRAETFRRQRAQR